MSHEAGGGGRPAARALVRVSQKRGLRRVFLLLAVSSACGGSPGEKPPDPRRDPTLTSPSLKRYDGRWIERSIRNWPSRRVWIDGDERQGTRSWLGRGAREIARLRFVGGKPYEGVRFVSDARGTRRRVEVIDHGQVIGFGLFRLAADGSWELVGSQWTYRGE